MPAKVTLAVSTGPLLGQRFEFAERTICTLGRHPETHPRLPDDADHATVSRRHCLLDINPPDIRVRDYGSRNGTFVNGENIGQRAEEMSAKDGAQLQFTDRDLKQGDQLQVGNTVFEIHVFVPPSCTDCSAEIPDEQRAASQFAPEQFRCAVCRERQEPTNILSQPPQIKERLQEVRARRRLGSRGESCGGLRLPSLPARSRRVAQKPSDLGEGETVRVPADSRLSVPETARQRGHGGGLSGRT